MSVEQKGEVSPIRQASTLSVSNFAYAVLDSPVFRMRIRIGRLAEDGKTVITKRGTILVDKADAKPGQKVVVYEI